MEMVKSLGMTLIYCPGLTCIKEGWQYHSLIYFQLSVKSDSISLPDVCAFAVLAVASPSTCTALERVLPRQVNLSTLAVFVHSQ